LPINLPTALQLANAQAIDIQVASQRIEVAAAQLDRAQKLWLPTIYLGTDYYRHDGQIQETQQCLRDQSHVLHGRGGSERVFAVSDAILSRWRPGKSLRPGSIFSSGRQRHHAGRG